MASENLHTGHRQRLKDRFLKEGLEHFEDHNILELLLFFGIPQRDTNPLAHELISRFGSFSQVFLADYDQLLAVKGMTPGAAILIKMVPAVYRRYANDLQCADSVLNTSDKIGNFLLPKFEGCPEEMIYLLCLNNACRLLRCDLLSRGGRDAADIDVRGMVEIAFACNATNVILAHNHPHGIARPSSQDVRVTRSLQPTLKQLGIELLDHFIIAQGQYVSMMELGYLGMQSLRSLGL